MTPALLKPLWKPLWKPLLKTLLKPPLAVTFTALLTGGLCVSALADPAPGEDPIQLQHRVSINMMPVNTPARSPTNTNPQEIPSWLDAKLARYQAKAYSADTTGITTEKDINNTLNSDGVRKTCTQDIASNTGSAGTTRYGPKNDPQVVVMRGDLVNICK
jgi:hypothetical protein